MKPAGLIGHEDGSSVCCSVTLDVSYGWEGIALNNDGGQTPTPAC